MIRLKGVLAGVTMAVLLLTTATAPAIGATARSGELVIVNGIPGTRVNVCINGRVVKWALPYGARIVRRVGAGSTGVRVFPASSRSCVGQHIAGRRFWLRNGGNKTIVASRREPRLVFFDNTRLTPEPSADDSGGPVVIRHAADVGTVRFVGAFTSVDPGPLTPTIAAVPAAEPGAWNKRDQLIWGIPVGPETYVGILQVERLGGKRIAGPVTTHLPEEFRHEWILVGTNRLNAKVVSFKRPSVP